MAAGRNRGSDPPRQVDLARVVALRGLVPQAMKFLPQVGAELLHHIREGIRGYHHRKLVAACGPGRFVKRSKDAYAFVLSGAFEFTFVLLHWFDPVRREDLLRVSLLHHSPRNA